MLCIDASQNDRVVLIRHGRPAAVVVGVKGQDWETVTRETSASFWKLITERRAQKTIPLAEVRRRFRGKT
jgi:antitoxin (DNA-binding transcriptional repressor) of toxin-antitoxin stability system